MENIEIYKDISKRTNGDIYFGVVGPVRTGKSTFIKNFMEHFVIPNIDNEYKKSRALEARVLVVLLSLALGYLVTNFITDFLNVSTLIK